MNIKETVRLFLQKKIGGEIKLADDADIFQLGLVNSLFALQLILFIEETFGITVASEDLRLDTFSQVNTIDAFIQKKLSAQSPQAK